MGNLRSAYRRAHFFLLLLLLTLGLSLTAAPPGHTRSRLQASPPTFSKAFAPATVGPGSSAVLTFTIDNATDSPVGNLAFSDTLPAGLTIAIPSSATTTCSNAILDVPDGGTTITFSDGRLGANSTCTVTVNVTTTSTPGTYTNVSGDLTSDAGNSGAATADLTVDGTLPGFSKTFAPATIYPDETSTLTFTVDNSANGSSVSVSFGDSLPEGVIVASPANAVADCPNSIVANPGETTINASAFVTAGIVCTINVDVTATSAGAKNNVSSGLNVSGVDAGFATALLTVEPPPAFHKRFLDNPAPPGGTATLEFSITNMDRRSSATGITFTDDLDAALTGLAANGLPTAGVCGTGSQLEGTSLLTMTGGELGPGESCTFTVTVQVPAAAVPGTYTNTTSDLTSDAGVMEPPATNELEIAPIPTLVTSFVPDRVGSGDIVDMAFTLVNNSQTNSATDINFNQVLGDVLPGTTVVTLPADGFCGAGSTMTQTTTPLEGLILVMSGGSLAPGDDCTFTASLQLATSTPNGTYTLTSSAPQATVDGETLSGRPASTDLTVVAPPRLTKSFTDDPVAAGDTVTLAFTLTQPEEGSAAATDITFTDDLDAALTGLAAVGLPADDVCGAGSRLEGTTNLTFTGGELAAGASCTFNVILQTPVDAAPGLYTNTTSNVSATMDGIAAEGPPASDDLEIPFLSLVKSFNRETVVQGDMVTLAFTLTNESPATSVTDIAFTDDLDAALPGLEAVGSPQADVCGAGSELSGTSLLTLTGGTLPPASSCTFVATLQVPAGAASGEYHNVTSQVTANADGTSLTADPAADGLVMLDALTLAKSFAAEAAVPGRTITLTFTITNESAASAITEIAFTDDLDAALSGMTAVDLPPDDFCGTGSSLSGTSLLTVSGGSLGPGETCTFETVLQIPDAVPAGTTAVNATSSITGSLGGATVTGPAATDELAIFHVAFTKSFDGPTAAGANPTLTFTIENVVSQEQTSLSFLDDLEAALPGLTAVETTSGDVCGPGSTFSGASSLTFTGGTLAAGQSCTFSATLQVPATAAPGSYLNTTSDLTSAGLTVSAPATDTLSVQPPPAFSKVFAPDPILLGATSTLTFTVDNGASAISATDLDFTDNLPAGLTIAAPANASTTCTGGTLTAPAGGSTITYSGGTVAAGAGCTVSVDVAGDAPGTHTNSSGALTSSSGDSGTASDTLTVNPPPAFGKVFTPDPIPLGASSTLTFTIDNGESTVAAVDLAFSDNLPAGLSIASPANATATCTGGTLTAPAGGATITYSGGSMAAGASCTVSVDVTGDAPGTHTNTSGVLTSSLGNSGTATATLTVNPPPAFDKTFAPNPVDVGDSSTLTFTIDNGASTVAATGLDFADNLPAGLTIATPANASTTCSGGTLTAPAGGATITYSGGSVAAGVSCTVAVDVTGDADGTYANTSSALTSSLGTSDAASDTLDVISPTIDVAVSAFPDSVPEPGDTVVITVVVTNGTPVESLTLATLVDDVHGDLDGQGSCDLPAVIDVGGSYTCAFSAPVSGNAGEAITNTVTATAVDADDNQATDQDSATVIIADVLPTVAARLTATPTVIFAPSDLVTFTLHVTNTSAVEAVTLSSLADDTAGDLDGLGDCDLPATIAAGNAYRCRYTIQITGQVGEAVTNTVTAVAEDDEGNPASAQASASVDVHGVLYYPFVGID